MCCLRSFLFILFSSFALFLIHSDNYGRIQDFFKEGIVSIRVQGKRPRANGMGEERGKIMFEYVDFRHFDFRGINLSNLRLLRAKSTVQQRQLFVSFFTRLFINQTN